MKNETVTFFLIRIFVLLFLYSAVAKFADFAEFRSELAKSPFLYPIAGFMAWLVAGSELLIGGLLLVNRTRRFALYTYFYMMAAFTAYVYLMKEKAYYLPCACMGIIDDLGWEAHLLFNSIVTILVLVTILLESNDIKSLKRLQHLPGRPKLSGSTGLARKDSFHYPSFNTKRYEI